MLGVRASGGSDQVLLDDLIVDGSACIGFDCVNGEAFDFDTIRIKENNLRIRAVDTSESASFPSRDWQITFNDSANGGANKFSIDDIDGGRTPFTIEAGAPSNSLYVDDGGRIGLGTSTPVVDVHVKSGNTPTLRLEQDGSSGFTPQTWDVVGNEANFFIRDATNGSTLPFRIFPGAPSNAINIEATTGDVGLGTTSPTVALDIERSGNVSIELNNTSEGEDWFINSVAQGLTFSRAATGILMTIAPSGNVDIPGGDLSVSGNLIVIGACADGDGGIGGAADGCDFVFDPGYELESIEAHAAYMWENSHLPAIGPTPEGKKISLNVQERHFGVLNELEKAHIYIERLNEKLNEQEAAIDQLNALVQDNATPLAHVQSKSAVLAKRLARLEALLLAEDH